MIEVINVYDLIKIKPDFFKMIIDDNKINKIVINRKNYYLIKDDVQKHYDFVFKENAIESVVLMNDYCVIENNPESDINSIKAQKHIFNRGVKELNKQNHINNIEKILSHVDTDVFSDTNVIASLDCEFYYDKKMPFIKEIGVIKINIKTKEVETLYFNITENKLDNKYNYLTSIVEAEIYTSFSDAIEKIDLFLKDVDVLIGHAISNDIKVLKKKGYLFSKDIVIADTQKMFSMKYNSDTKTLFDCADFLQVDCTNLLPKKINIKELAKQIDDNNFLNTKGYKNYMYQELILHNAFNDAYLTMVVYLILLNEDQNFEKRNICRYDFLNGIKDKINIQYHKNIFNFIKKKNLQENKELCS